MAGGGWFSRNWQPISVVTGILGVLVPVALWLLSREPPPPPPSPEVTTTTTLSASTTLARGPTEVDLLPGVLTMLSSSEAWVCSGDIKVHKSGGIQEELFDNDQRTGLVVVIPVGNTFRLEAPRDGGYCRIGGQEAVPTFKQAMSNPPNCRPLAGCPTVNVVTLGPRGDVLRRE